MSKATKSEAKLAIDNYGNLLKERAVIGEIITDEVRGELEYKFIVQGEKPFEIACRGFKETALVLSAMWLAYESSYKLLFPTIE